MKIAITEEQLNIIREEIIKLKEERDGMGEYDIHDYVYTIDCIAILERLLENKVFDLYDPNY